MSSDRAQAGERYYVQTQRTLFATCTQAYVVDREKRVVAACGHFHRKEALAKKCGEQMLRRVRARLPPGRGKGDKPLQARRGSVPFSCSRAAGGGDAMMGPTPEEFEVLLEFKAKADARGGAWRLKQQ